MTSLYERAMLVFNFLKFEDKEQSDMFKELLTNFLV